MTENGRNDGSRDVARAVKELEGTIPPELAPLARLAYNFWWSWTPGAADLFREIAPERFELCQENPIRLLREAPSSALERAANNSGLVERALELERTFRDECSAPPEAGQFATAPPVAFFCLEYGIHRSLPIYSGGLGVLAGDILKEASDRYMNMVGVGLMYSQGAYHQRLDPSGWQHDYWTEIDPELVPAALVRTDDGKPLTVDLPLRDRTVVLRVWRTEVGRIPLYLLDARIPENDVADRWITARLYVGDQKIRLAQYAAVGVAGIKALRALGIEPQVYHLNEGHPALAPLELAAEAVERGAAFDDAIAEARTRTVFTTHTPVPAGNETYSPDAILDVLGHLPERLGVEKQRFLHLGQSSAEGADDGFGMTTLALRLSRVANGVSRRHGDVAREMWRPLYPGTDTPDVPIGHVTNGVHVPTWMADPMRELLDRHLPAGWIDRASDPATWAAVDTIPDEELWSVRNRLRTDLVNFARERSAQDRLARGEPSDSVRAARETFDPGVLTLGFARRVATYKRLQLLIRDPERAERLLDEPRPVQFLLAGKAHPDDEEAKRNLHRLFEQRWGRRAGLRVTYLEDYDMSLGARLVSGCDVWVNVPRPPLEASGTSGMKAALNGGINLSVLDGWWAEASDGSNGWAIEGAVSGDHDRQDEQHADALYDLLENEVVPLFYDRQDGIPRGWVARIKASLKTIGPAFSATRMMRDYVRNAYRSG